MYDRAYGRLRPFLIPRVLRMIMDFVVLGMFSVDLRSFWGSLGLLFARLGVLLGARGGCQGALRGFLGPLVGLFGAILSSQTDLASFWGAL